MCGICGFSKKNNNRTDKQLIAKMNNLLSHRGPDGQGFYIDEKIALGHKRLSIIDLARGTQPMEDEKYVIIFNGEIYNYKELKNDLEKKGYKFKTNSDTEVLLKIYEYSKEKCLDKLEGMFAFAIWDKQKKELFTARDRLGVKPLYYTILNKEIIFASEIKSILAYPGFKRKLNEKVLNSYFQYRYILGNETFFENIYSLLPGHYLKFDKSKELKIKSYWFLPIAVKKEDKGEKYYIKKTRDLVTESIKKRLISDVPLGVYLSGGLDSSIITAVMAKLKRGEKVKSFSIGFKEQGFNEFEYARQVAKMWNTDHHEILLDAEGYFKEMEKLISYKDAPLSVPNEVPLYLLSKELKKHITVVLSGEGADELFGGYGRIFVSYIDFLKSRPATSRGRGSPTGVASLWTSIKSGQNNKNYPDFFLQKYNYVKDQDIDKILSKRVKNRIFQKKYTRLIFKRYFDRIKNLDVKDKPLYIFQNLHLQGLLQRLDSTTMASSVEGRVPFVDDHNLIEFINEVPFEYKVKWKQGESLQKALDNNFEAEQISEKLDITKYLLKKAFKDYLPKEIIERNKIGFPVPLDNWFKGDFKAYAKRILLDKRTIKRGIFNKEYLISGKIFEELSGINIWMMINLELFLRKYFS